MCLWQIFLVCLVKNGFKKTHLTKLWCTCILFFCLPRFSETVRNTQVWTIRGMGQGSSRAGRLTKEDVMFLKANTRYDEDTIQVEGSGSSWTESKTTCRSGTRASYPTALTGSSPPKPSWRSTANASQVATPETSATTSSGSPYSSKNVGSNFFTNDYQFNRKYLLCTLWLVLGRFIFTGLSTLTATGTLTSKSSFLRSTSLQVELLRRSWDGRLGEWHWL